MSIYKFAIVITVFVASQSLVLKESLKGGEREVHHSGLASYNYCSRYATSRELSMQLLFLTSHLNWSVPFPIALQALSL